MEGGKVFSLVADASPPRVSIALGRIVATGEIVCIKDKIMHEILDSFDELLSFGRRYSMENLFRIVTGNYFILGTH